MRHETQPEMNMDPDQVLRYCQHVLGDNRPKVGTNLIYDIGWLRHENVHVGGMLYDVQFAEALLNSETPSVCLESLASRYLGLGKASEALYEWLALWLGGKPNDRQRAHVWRAPPSLVGPYAESDAALPIKILEAQWPQLERRGVLNLFHIESRLIPLLVAMRMKGAPVDVDVAEQTYEELGGELIRIGRVLRDIVGFDVNPNAGESIKVAFNHLSIPVPMVVNKKTGDESASFAAGLLEKIDHPLCEAILEYRRTAKVRDTFIKSYIIDKNVNGRIHCTFHPLKGDKNGARSGRFASSDPNLQNIPSRTEMGKRVRRAFASRDGRKWAKWDFSQIEYRMLAHHAVGPGSDELRLSYNADPNTDYHALTTELIRLQTGVVLPRTNTKSINFGLIYGMQEPKLIHNLGLSKADGKALFIKYHEAAPFTKATMDAAADEVRALGYVETILGRRSDFDSWSSKTYDPKRTALSHDAACAKWGSSNIERAMLHKALNRKLQGGAADAMKKAMVDAYEAGLFADDACGIPLLTVHDELDFEVDDNCQGEHWTEFKRVMENAIPSLRVPVRMDLSIGDNWGDAD
jgi:DNA polymerase-1